MRNAGQKHGCRRRDINNGVFINEKEKKSTAKTVVREIFLLYHLLPLVVTRCHSLSLVPLVVTRYHLMYHSSVTLWTILSPLCYHAQKATKFCLLIHFRWVDVKSSRCFSGISLISIIWWEYCENNIKMFSYYPYENKK